MRKLLFICSLIVITSLFFVAPAYASGSDYWKKTRTPAPRVTATPAAQVETAKQVFYTAVWNTCLTMTVQDHPEYTSVEITQNCRQVYQLATANEFYENMHSDMFRPVPADLLLSIR